MGRHRRLPNSYVSDWTNGLGDDWANVTGSSQTVEIINDKPHLRVGGGVGYRVMPRFVIPNDGPFEVVVNFRISAPTSGYHGIVLYSGEANYLGVYFDPTPANKPTIIDLSPNEGYEHTNDPIARSTWTYETGDYLRVKFTHTPATYTTKIYIAKNEEEFPVEADWMRVSLSGGGVYHTDFPPVLSLWLSGNADSYLDFGDIAATRTAATEVLAGAFDYYPWSSKWNNTWDCMDWSAYLSYYEPVWNPTNNIPFIQDSGEHTPQYGGLTFMPYDHPSGDTNFKGGTYTVLSGAITGVFNRLKLYGSQGPVGQGSFKVRVLGSNALTLISDTLIPGNSAGFFPDAGPHVAGTDVDLSSVPAGTIYLEYSAQYTGNGAYWIWPDEWEPAPTLHGFMVDGLQLPPFAPPAGSYPSAQEVTLTDPAGGIIIYTLDGTDPRDYIVTSGGLAVFSEGELVTTGDVQ